MHSTYRVSDFINIDHPSICHVRKDIVSYHCFFISLFISEQGNAFSDRRECHRDVKKRDNTSPLEQLMNLLFP
jgi:hypothetical protein